MLLRQLSVRRPCNMIYVLVKGISPCLDVWGCSCERPWDMSGGDAVEGRHGSLDRCRLHIAHVARLQDCLPDTARFTSTQKCCFLASAAARVNISQEAAAKGDAPENPMSLAWFADANSFMALKSVFICTNPFCFCCEENARRRKQHNSIGEVRSHGTENCKRISWCRDHSSSPQLKFISGSFWTAWCTVGLTKLALQHAPLQTKNTPKTTNM